MSSLEPRRPGSVDPFAVEILERLAAHPEASEIVLGGHFALKHYLDFRATHDIDAWWKTGPRQATTSVLREVMQAVADAHGLRYAEREFGDTLSMEIGTGREKVFSFQIAVRSIELEPPVPSPWPPIPIETIADNVGSKMSALVNRGLARDFVDIKAVVKSGLVTSDDCWKLWQRKNPERAMSLAKKQVLKHLTGIELRRPLETILDPMEREHAAENRQYFKETFVRGPSL